VEERPRLLIKLSCHAPKVAIPEASGRNTLLLDLGLFTLTSVRAADAGLSGEEAALFECLELKIESVSAYLHDAGKMGGRFTWPSARSQSHVISPKDSLLQQLPSEAHGLSISPGDIKAPSWDLFNILSHSQVEEVQLVPLLEKFHVDVQLQVATSVHPILPQV
jgi:hypothetical protein